MARKLPADFDPERYRAEHPDVALSGLAPAQHYLLFGRIMGRSSAPGPKIAREVTPEPQEAPKPTKPPKAEPPKAEPKPTSTPKPIIDRPADFDPKQSTVRPAPPKQGARNDGSFAPGSFGGAGAAYEQMLRRREADAQVRGVEAPQGPVRFDNAWVTADGVLRLTVGDHGGEAQGWAVRAYQAEPADASRLHLLAPGALLPQRGPALVEFELKSRLMPLLVELSDASGAGQELALLPFPSLLPGGMHNAELRALQSEANPMQAFWALSGLLLRELVAEPGGPDFSIGRISGSLTGEVRDWLAAVFGFERSEAGALSRNSGSAALSLPSDCIPTIGALASRSLEGGGTGPYLVADSDTFRSRWSVVPPHGWGAEGRAPMIEGAAADAAPSLHLAIALRPTPAPKLSGGEAPKEARADRRISVLLDASDPQRSDGAAAALRSLLGAHVDLITGSDLRAASAQAKHDLLLTISDKVDLGDGAVLDTLAEMLSAQQVASASCLLLREVSLKKQKVLQPATGGLFPAGVSFATAPSLTFAEPDVLQALRDATYPVVANTLHLTLWRTSALADLPRPSRPLPASAQDIEVGLALAERGFISLCTTKVSARLGGDYSPRDAIDPIGQSRLDPGDWQQLLRRVMLLRQLF